MEAILQNNEVPIKRPRGRPVGTTADPETLKMRINVTLDAEHQEIARVAGNGNVSAGLRVTLDFWNKKHMQK